MHQPIEHLLIHVHIKVIQVSGATTPLKTGLFVEHIVTAIQRIVKLQEQLVAH